jgi:hypothetical protein
VGDNNEKTSDIHEAISRLAAILRRGLEELQNAGYTGCNERQLGVPAHPQ